MGPYKIAVYCILTKGHCDFEFVLQMCSKFYNWLPGSDSVLGYLRTNAMQPLTDSAYSAGAVDPTSPFVIRRIEQLNSLVAALEGSGIDPAQGGCVVTTEQFGLSNNTSQRKAYGAMLGHMDGISGPKAPPMAFTDALQDPRFSSRISEPLYDLGKRGPPWPHCAVATFSAYALQGTGVSKAMTILGLTIKERSGHNKTRMMLLAADEAGLHAFCTSVARFQHLREEAESAAFNMCDADALATLSARGGTEVVNLADVGYDITFRDELVASKVFPGVQLLKSNEAGE